MANYLAMEFRKHHGRYWGPIECWQMVADGAGKGRTGEGEGGEDAGYQESVICLRLSLGIYLLDISGQANIPIFLSGVSIQSRARPLPYNISLNARCILQDIMASTV